jgi:isoleucyl-tRNA synthetase
MVFMLIIAYKAARAISEFVQENLSNWYVRVQRRRFWKASMRRIKLLIKHYTCLLTISKLGAAIAPSFMDKLYRDLTQANQKN